MRGLLCHAEWDQREQRRSGPGVRGNVSGSEDGLASHHRGGPDRGQCVAQGKNAQGPGARGHGEVALVRDQHLGQGLRELALLEIGTGEVSRIDSQRFSTSVGRTAHARPTHPLKSFLIV